MNKETTAAGAAAVALLQQLIAVPSLSKDEAKAARVMVQFLSSKNIPCHFSDNNVWATNKYFDTGKPSVLLNSHLDTVAPAASYSRDPFLPEVQENKLFGLGSTDAGASLACLAVTFAHFYEAKHLPYNLVFAATAEEEISGAKGIESLFKVPAFSNCFVTPGSFAIVGEPTGLDLAVAEKGLLVLDCVARGISGHAARNDGVNAIYKAMTDIAWFRTYRFEKQSVSAGEIKMTVTTIETENKTHNVIPASCHFTVDIRVTDAYTHEEILATIKAHTNVEIKPRSMRLRPSAIPVDHPIVAAGLSLGKKTFASPTLSDQALIPLPSLKCGPGSSVQSHSADEFVLIKDIEAGAEFYIQLISKLTGI